MWTPSKPWPTSVPPQAWVAAPAALTGRVPGAHEDVAVHDDVALARGAARVVDDLLRVGRILDVEDPEAGVGALVGVLALEREVRVDRARARAAGRHGPRRVPDGRQVRRVLERAHGVLHGVGGRRRVLERPGGDRAPLALALVLDGVGRIHPGPPRAVVQRQEAARLRHSVGARMRRRGRSRQCQRGAGSRAGQQSPRGPHPSSSPRVPRPAPQEKLIEFSPIFQCEMRADLSTLRSSVLR